MKYVIIIALTSLAIIGAKEYVYSVFNHFPLFEEVNLEVNNVKTFFKFNITDDSKILSDEDLKKYGGDCKDWTEYYQRHINAKNQKILYSLGNKSHMFLLVYDNDGYCIIDQTTYHCNKIG